MSIRPKTPQYKSGVLIIKMQSTEQQKTIEFGLKLRREELRDEIRRLEKLRTSDFARRDFKMEKLNEEFEDIQESIKRLEEFRNK